MLQPYTSQYASYLFDESRIIGRAEYVAFPREEGELAHTVRFCYENNIPITAQGALTGLSGGASPQGGLLLNLSKMNRMLGLRQDGAGRWLLRVQPGVLLTQVRKALLHKSFDASTWSEESIQALGELKAGALFFSPDPTESTASLGGMAACNACGARSFLYGSTRAHVQALRVVLADGRVAALERGLHRAVGLAFSIPCTDGSTLNCRLPAFETPHLKDAGYYLHPNMDLVDLFMGSQGTLGIISQLELILQPAPALLAGVMAFFQRDESALAYVRHMKTFAPKPAAIEYFGKEALALVEAQRAETKVFQQIQELPEECGCAVYVELNLDSPEGLYPALEALAEVLEGCGGNREDTWVARDALELEQLLFLRHAVPETIDIHVERNKRAHPGITILSTDMAVEDAFFEQLFRTYQADLQATGLHWLIFGHIGENHVHPNILARNMQEYEQGHALFEKWARDVHALGGTITAEHGAGKMKRKLQRMMYGDEKMAQLWAFKKQLDEKGLLGPGNVLTDVEGEK